MLHNMLLSSNHSYDAKQRIVGGIVLFFLLMLLYISLKLMLGISVTGKDYAFDRAEQDEIENAANSALLENSATEEDVPKGEPRYPVIDKFVFLGLDEQPLGQSAVEMGSKVDADLAEMDGSKKWVVQVASLKSHSSANKLIKRLANKQLSANLTRSGSWFVVSLTGQQNKADAEQQLNKLKDIGITGLLRHK